MHAHFLLLAILVMGLISRNFRKFLLPGPLFFDFFRLFIMFLKVHDERNRMGFVPSKSAG